MNALGIAGWAIAIAVAAISAKSAAALGARSKWTILGWIGTFGWAVALAAEVLRGRALPWYCTYVPLGAMALAFAIAAVRDEPQAEPWWWPSHAGTTRAERELQRR